MYQHITCVLIGKRLAHIKFDVLCLHPSIMATDLRLNGALPLNLLAGMGVTFKSSTFSLARDRDHIRVNFGTYLDLYNINNDIILRITIRQNKNKLFFNDRAGITPTLRGDPIWGEEQSVELSPADVDRWQHSGVTISVQDCSTPSKKQYRILLNETAVYCFLRRFSGPATHVYYSTMVNGSPFDPLLSDPLNVFTYDLNDIPDMEGQVVESQRRVDSWGCFRIAHEKPVLLRQL